MTQEKHRQDSTREIIIDLCEWKPSIRPRLFIVEFLTNEIETRIVRLVRDRPIFLSLQTRWKTSATWFAATVQSSDYRLFSLTSNNRPNVHSFLFLFRTKTDADRSLRSSIDGTKHWPDSLLRIERWSDDHRFHSTSKNWSERDRRSTLLRLDRSRKLSRRTRFSSSRRSNSKDQQSNIVQSGSNNFSRSQFAESSIWSSTSQRNERFFSRFDATRQVEFFFFTVRRDRSDLLQQREQLGVDLSRQRRSAKFLLSNVRTRQINIELRVARAEKKLFAERHRRQTFDRRTDAFASILFGQILVVEF